MVKKVCYLLLLLSGVESLYGQDDDKRFKPGVQFGFNASYFNNRIGEFGANAGIGYEHFVRFSPALGFHGRWKLSDLISIHAEVLYNLRGGSYRLENSSVIYLGGSGNEQAYYYKNYRLNYLELPFLASLNCSKLFNKDIPDYKLQVRLNTGLAPAFNTSSSLRYNGFKTISNGTPLADVDEKYEVEEFDYAESFMVSYLAEILFDFKNGSGTSMFINLRLSQALLDVYNVDRLRGYNMKTKMTTFTLGFGCLF